MAGLLPDVDPDGLLEFSVVFTDRSLNHMSKNFQQVMNDISTILKSVYSADGVAIVPGGGTFAMEAVARQLATGKKCLVVRNGWFSYRWTQIFESGNIPASAIVLKARTAEGGHQKPFSPAPVEQVVATIEKEKPDVVFAPHVETSSGMILPDDYVRQVGNAVRAYGGLFVLDCIASGTVWVDMKRDNVDVLISAPQKGWSASPAAGLVMMNDRALETLSNSVSTSFAGDLKKWHEIMQAYLDGGHAYHATMPTDSLVVFRDIMLETKQFGFDRIRSLQIELGQKIRELLENRGFNSVAADGFKAPGVVVSYTDDPDIKSGVKFANQGVQIAAGVPLMCDEPEGYSSFRIGLFGIDKLKDVDATVKRFQTALNQIN